MHFSQVLLVKKCIQLQKLLGVLFVMCIGMILFFPAITSAQVTLSGTLYSDAGVTPQAVSKFIAVAVGTSTPSVFSTTTLTTTGAWTVTIPAGHNIGTSTPILVWVNDDVTTRASVLTKASSSASVQSITGLDLYQDRVIVRHEASSGTSTTFADFAFYTSVQDSDLQHSTSSGLLTVAPGNELYIWGGDTFAPGSGLIVQGNASVSSTDGSMYIATSSIFTAGGVVTLGGSLRTASTATYNGGPFTTFFNATTTGKIIDASIASIGNVTFSGVGGAWAFTSAATTSALTILRGEVTAPNTTLGVTGTFQNDASFLQGGGTINIIGAATVALSDIALFANGLDVSGSAGGVLSQNITSFLMVSTTLYVGQSGVGTACANTAGGAQGCELLIFNVASSSNPTFVAGRDSNGSGVGTSTIGITNLVASGTALYAVKGASATACAQVAGGAIGCELLVFNISSTTNPIFAAGRDADGSLTGTTNIAGTGLAASGTALYMSKVAAGTTNCSTTASNCEVLVFNISSTTNPLYIYGLDASGSNAGTLSVQVNNITVSGGALYVVKAGLGTTCSQTAGSAQGCELMVFNISSTTLPVYTRGIDVNGSQTGIGNLAISTLLASGTSLYLGTAASSSRCTQTTGSIEGCELQMYDIASTTNPVFMRGVDVAGNYTGQQALGINNFAITNSYLYVAKVGNATPCVQGKGLTLGCELLIYDVASSSAVRLLGARDADGSATGTTATAANAVVPVGQSVILGKAAAGTTACSTARLNCELMIFSASTTPKGFLFGSLTGSSALGNIVTSGSVEFKDNASVTQLTIASGTTTAPSYLTLFGDYTNNGILLAGEGTMDFASSADQTLSGTLVGTSSPYRLRFSGIGTTTISTNASTNFLEISSGVTVVAPAQLTVADTFSNNGTFVSNGGTLITNGFLNSFMAGLSVGGTATDTVGTTINAFAQKGNTLYVAKAGNVTTCSQVPGLAIGCELLVFNIASTTNPIFAAGLDVNGTSTGTGNLAILDLAVSGDALYVAKTAAGTTACSNTAGTGALACELMVFNISSSTNPIYTKGLDATGSNAGTSTLAINRLLVAGNNLYVAKAGSTTACSQIAGVAGGCEFMIFSISSTTDPVYLSGRDADGNAAGVTATAATGLAISSSTLYLSKTAAGATACTTQANCELMVFNVASSTNPLYVTGIDASGNAAGAQSVAINNITVSGSQLYVVKAGGGTACSNTAGSTGAASCELMVFNISSTTNVIYRAGVDVTGSTNAGTGNQNMSSVVATGTVVYVIKSGTSAACSQITGSALGCELMVFDASSSTNPVYVAGRDADGTAIGQTATVPQSIFSNSTDVFVGKASETTVCELEIGLRTGCELLMFTTPTTLAGTLTDTSGFATVTTNGLTQLVSPASTTNITIASSSQLTAPTSSLSISGNLTINGSILHNLGGISFNGTNQAFTAAATTTLYDFMVTPPGSATTSFSTNAPFVILNNLTLLGAATSTPLKLRSINSGTQWRIDPWSSTTISLGRLDVQDSNNISATATPLVCGAGCLDSGNNTNWLLGFLYTISGTLFAEDGVTPYATATVLRIAVPVTSSYFANATSATTTGTFSFVVPDSFLATGNPYLVYADNAPLVKATTISKNGTNVSNVTGFDLFRNHVIIRSEGGTSSAITNYDLAKYSNTDDSDILYSLTSDQSLTVLSPAALMVWDNGVFAPGNSVTVAGTATTTPTVGSMYLRNGSTYAPSVKTTLAGSLRASTTAIYTPDVAVLEFNATSANKTIDSQLASLGNVLFNGTGGAWSFTQTNATTSDFDIERGTVTAPSGTLIMNGIFTNNATFTNNGATLSVVGNSLSENDRAARFVAGTDVSGSKTGSRTNGFTSLDVSGNYLYRTVADNPSACSQVAGNANVIGCEIAVFDISSTTNPVYVAGRDASGSAAGTANQNALDLKVQGNYLYVVKSGNATPCSQVVGSAIGCELMVFDIASRTNPTYVAGRDVSGDATGTSSLEVYEIETIGEYLYLTTSGSSTACSQIAGLAVGCELQVYNISNPTNPTYIAGRDASGSNAGTASKRIGTIFAYGTTLYVGKDGDNSVACSQVAGSALGCELMYFNIASATNPVFAGGRDGEGSANGSQLREIFSVHAAGNTLVIGKEGGFSACVQDGNNAIGCEIITFDISSTTNPIFTAGRDVSGDGTGTDDLAVNSVRLHGNNLYVGKVGTSTPCSQIAGQAMGCELMVFDISSTTNPTYIAGRDSSGSTNGTTTVAITEIEAVGQNIYIGKDGQNNACTQTITGTGAYACELMIFQSLQPAGILAGTLTGASSLSTLETQNQVSLLNNASTTNITVNNGSILATPTNLSLSGDLTNNGFLSSALGNTFQASSSATQNLTGTATSSAYFNTLTFGGSGTKNLAFNATTTTLLVPSNVTVNQTGRLTVGGDYTNNGTLNANTTAELVLSGANPIGTYIAGRDADGSTTGTSANLVDQMFRQGDYLYIAKGFNSAACSQSIGAAQGCELQVYDVSSSTNPVYVAGRDSTGNSGGTGATYIAAVTANGNFLFVGKDADATACSQTAGSATGCELMIFNISTPSNPVYVAGRDASGNSAGTGAVPINDLIVVGNYLYVTKDPNASACSQTAGSANGCELMVFDISTPTNPTYVAGRDSSGDSAGTGAVTIERGKSSGNYLFVTKFNDPTACSQTAGSANGCELMVFDISTPTNPTYVAGRDASGDSSGTGNILMRQIALRGNSVYVTKDADATACSQTAGSAIGCELMVFNISSPTNPVYTAGRDSTGDSSGVGVISIRDISVNGNKLYVTKNGDATACSQTAGLAIGCELMAFDISSSSNPIYSAGVDASASRTGTISDDIRNVFSYDNVVYTTGGDGTACSQVAGSAIGCEFKTYTIGSILRGNMTGASAHKSVTVTGPAEWYSNASTSNLAIISEGNMTAPSNFSLTGNFSNDGTFNSNSGTVTLLGTDQSISSSDTTTFNNFIQVATTSATTTFSSTGSFVTTGLLRLNGTSTGRLKIKSDIDGTQWRILPLGTATSSWLEVKDSRNSSSTYISCTDNCIDRGNNMNWLFFPTVLGTGSTTLAQHTAGQVSNSFGSQNETDRALLAFRLQPTTGTTTYSALLITLSGVTGIAQGVINNFRLVVDTNSNRVYDGGDILIGGAGDLNGAGSDGTLGFYEPFVATSSRNYLVIADWAGINNGSFFTIGLTAGGVRASNASGAHAIFGSTVSFQHSRNNRSAGGGGGSVGGDAPAGDGNVGGGGSVGGELIGNDPDFFGPSADSGSWVNGALAYDGVDGTYASTSSAVNHSYNNHGFAIPATNVIGGIVVKLEVSGSTAAGSINVQLSWDGGASWTSAKTTPTMTTNDTVRTLGSPSDLWGRTWAPGEFSNANFAVRIAGNPSANSLRLDAIQVRVYHVAGGGGSGGGGGGGGI